MLRSTGSPAHALQVELAPQHPPDGEQMEHVFRTSFTLQGGQAEEVEEVSITQQLV